MMLAALCAEGAQFGTEVLATHSTHGTRVDVVEMLVKDFVRIG